MKKLIYLLVVLGMFSCSTDDLTEDTNNKLNPPEWIQGTWLLNEAGSLFNIGFTFTEDDVIVYNVSLPTSLSDSIDEYTEVNESITDSEYYIVITYLDGTQLTYDFRYLNTNSIGYGTNTVLMKQ